MSRTGVDPSWLPDHQLHVTATLAHADRTIDEAIRLIHAYTEPGVLTLAEKANGDGLDVVVQRIAPLPAAIPRLVADALTQLRAVMEHALYAEVEFLLGRPLRGGEEHRIEMPATTTVPAFDKWLKDKKRPALPPLRTGEPLTERIRRLQPFNRADPDDHPLRLLAAHTNQAKHRTPAVVATRLGAVYPDRPRADISVALPLELRPQPGHGRDLGVGDVLATVPRGSRVELNIMPMVCLQRPHTGIWNIAIKELELLEEWVRTVAIPIIITGSHNVEPLPPQLDITIGHDDLRRALAVAGGASAADRGSARIGAVVSRPNLVELLLHVEDAPGRDVLSSWVDSLDSTTVVECVIRLQQAAGDAAAVIATCKELLAEARQYAASIGQQAAEGQHCS